MEIDASDLEDELEAAAEEAAEEVANRWFSRSQDILNQRAMDLDYDLFPIMQSGQPPQRTSDGRYKFKYMHEAARFFEWGTSSHEIRADDGVLAFEWPDAPQTVREMFAETFPTVFFKQVEVSGIPAIRYIRDSRVQVRREMME